MDNNKKSIHIQSNIVSVQPKARSCSSAQGNIIIIMNETWSVLPNRPQVSEVVALQRIVTQLTETC